MTEMILAWLVAPLALFLICLGLGLLIKTTSKQRSKVTTLTAAGFLLLIVIGSLLTVSSVTAPSMPYIIVVLSVLGLVRGAIYRKDATEFELLPIIGGALTFIVFSLPVLAYGRPSWAGWVKLDDTASFFAVTDRIMNAGQSVPGVVTSTFDRIIQVLLGGNGLNYGSVTNTHFVYPIGTFIPFGTISKLTGMEKAWLFQPYLAFAAGLAAMIVISILGRQLRFRYLLIAAGCVSIAASTIYSYVMWGGIKEIVITVPIAFMALVLFGESKKAKDFDRWVYVFLCSAALYFIGGLASFGFAAMILLTFALVQAKRKSKAVFFAIPAIIVVGILGLWLEFRISGKNIIGDLLVPKIKDSGNLTRPLSIFQTFGVWPSQDFRVDPVFKFATFAVIMVVIAFVIVGLYSSVLRGFWTIPSIVIAVVAVLAYSNFYGGIWLTGKAIAVASPFMLLTASVGIYQAWQWAAGTERNWVRSIKLKYVIVGVAVVVGSSVLVSDVFTYKNVWLAPYSQMHELETIGKLYSGQGPALMTEYSVFGARYFLRNLDAESASELRVHLIPMSDGSQVPKGFAADISLFDPNVINYYRLLVLRKSLVASRPPLNYHLVWSGTHYEVWERLDRSPVIKKMMSLGNNFTPGSVPSCQAVKTFFADRAKTEKIYTVIRDKTYVISFSNGDLPSGWTPVSGLSGAVDRSGTGGFSRTFSVDRTDFYNLSLAGSFPGQLRLLIDGEQVFSGHSFFEGNPTLTNTLTRVHIAAGQHVLTLVYTSPILMPGSDVATRFGPIFLSTQFAGDSKVKQVSISRIPQLCTENLDWIATTN